MENTLAMGGERIRSNAPMGEEERKTRIELAACYRLAEREGWGEKSAGNLRAALDLPVLTDRRQDRGKARMQFHLIDLALTFAALVGYRALEVAVRRGSQSPRHRDVPRAP